jgi:putative inorganic carbon (HCO3(-)) transporter
VQTVQRTNKDNFLFYLTCLYLLVFYYQPGGRIPVLGVLRFEFLLGSGLLGVIFFMRWGHIFTNERMTKAAILFFGALCLSFVGAIETHTASEAFGVFVQVLKHFSIYLMIVGTVDSEWKLERFVWVFLFCMAIVVGEPFLLSLRGENFYLGEGGLLRLRGVGQFDSPNALGMNAVVLLILLYFLFSHYRSRIFKVIAIGFGAVCFRVIMLTASRTAYLGLIFLVAIIFLYTKKKKAFLLSVSALVLVFLLTVPDVYKERFFSLKEVPSVMQSEERQEGSIGGRWALFVDSWTVFLDHPIFGCGMDSFRRISIHEKIYATYGETHNLLMEVLAETGVVGFFAFIFLMSTIWKTLTTTKRTIVSLQDKPQHMVALIVTLQMLFLLKLSTGLVAQNNLYSNTWWLIGGMAAVSARIAADYCGSASAALAEGSPPRSDLDGAVRCDRRSDISIPDQAVR